MRNILLAVPVVLLLASNAGAQTAQYPATDDVASVSTVRVTAPYRLNDAEVEAVSGKYALSNGWRLGVENGVGGMVARIDRERPFRLIPVSADKFVSRDGNVIMEFNRGKLGDEMVMSYLPNQRFAVWQVVSATLAQR